MEAAVQTAADAEKWIALMKQYVNPVELTAELLNTSSEMMASWVFSTRYHSSCGFRTFFLFLNETVCQPCGADRRTSEHSN